MALNNSFDYPGDKNLVGYAAHVFLKNSLSSELNFLFGLKEATALSYINKTFSCWALAPIMLTVIGHRQTDERERN